MARGLLARKVGMTQLFTDRGTVVPVTVLEADSCHVVQRKTMATDSYDALQLGFGEQRQHRVTKPMRGHFKQAGTPLLRTLAEVRDAAPVEVGTQLHVDLFREGELVDVIGVSKGKGFAGTIKRHRFHRGPVSHGSNTTRRPGSIGSVDAARTFKGIPMGGHMGMERVTARNLQVIRVDKERKLLLVRGTVPGPKNGVVLVHVTTDSEVPSA